MYKAKIKAGWKAALKLMGKVLRKIKRISYVSWAGIGFFLKYIFYSYQQMRKQLPREGKTIVFTLEEDRLFRDQDGMGRYAYLTLNAFSEGGYNVYLHKNVDSVRKFIQLGRYGRFIYSVKNLKFVSCIPDHIRTEETVYAFDMADQNLFQRKWKKLIYVNILKPVFCIFLFVKLV